MLVLSRKKNEAILIDGVIRVEVVTVTKAAVRVRIQAPRGLNLPYDSARGDLPARVEGTPRPIPLGLDVSYLTLVNQQIITLGESISLGVIDADRARALFFIDAPLGMNVTAIKPQEPDLRNLSSRQNLLQFMGQVADRPAEDRAKPPPPDDHQKGGSDLDLDEASPKLIPFPEPGPRRQRL